MEFVLFALQAYLSGHDKQFGHDFCVRLFGRLDSPPKLDEFVSVMKDVEEICKHLCVHEK